VRRVWANPTSKLGRVPLDREESRKAARFYHTFALREAASGFRVMVLQFRSCARASAADFRDATQRRDPKLARRARENGATRASPIGDNRRRGARMPPARRRAGDPAAYYQRAWWTSAIRRRDGRCVALAVSDRRLPSADDSLITRIVI